VGTVTTLHARPRAARAAAPPLTTIGRVTLVSGCLALLVACSARQPSGRYVAEHFRTTRTNFVYVRDRVTGQWMNRHCELRVPVVRPLPDPLMTDEHGSLLSVQLFDPESVRSAGLRSVDFDVREGFRVWVIDDVLEEADVDGHTSYGVQVAWPETPTRYDPLELFHLPRLGNDPPGTWSPWVVAGATREGAFGWWEEAHGAPAEPSRPIARPFELRCQVVATDTPGVVR
jgi:hypothetical protein